MNTSEENLLLATVDALQIKLSAVEIKQKTLTTVLFEALSLLPPEIASDLYSRYVDYYEFSLDKAFLDVQQYLLQEDRAFLNANKNAVKTDFSKMRKDVLYHPQK